MSEASAINDQAITLLNAGDAAAAAEGFRRAIKLQPTSAESYFNLGIALKDLSRHQDSAVAYLAALELRPTFHQAHFNLGRCFQIIADDLGPGGTLRNFKLRRQSLQRAAHHFRRATTPGPLLSPDATRSLEVRDCAQAQLIDCGYPCPCPFACKTALGHPRLRAMLINDVCFSLS
jgi:tetratricopeptide (TPR) repeat protein